MRTPLIAVTTLLAATAAAHAGSHLWRFSEVFSNADGTIQFVELQECCGYANEIFLDGKDVASDATGNTFVFTEDLPRDSTAEAYLLLATAGYAALPGVPAPDHIVADGFFDQVNGDDLRYWFYPDAVMNFGPGSVPFDGLTALQESGTPAPASPTNFAGENGTMNLPCLAADTDVNATVNVDDLVNVISAWGTADPDADANDDGVINVDDLVAVISHWGDC